MVVRGTLIERSQGGQVGYVPDFHPGSPGLTPFQGSLPYMTT